MRRAFARTTPALVFPVCGTLFLAACPARQIRSTTREPIVASPERLERGEYLVRHVTACGACHASRSSGSVYAEEEWEAPLSGGNTFVDGDLAVWVPNLTSDEETGLGQWSDDEIARAIRDGIRRDGSRLLPMLPFNEFQYL